MPAGRPSEFTEEIADEFCRRLSDGLSERQICQAEDMPSRETVRLWRFSNKEFLAKCARAREEQGHGAVDEMAEIEQAVLAGAIPADVARVVLSSKQWRASKLARASYGEKVDLKVDATVKAGVTYQANIPQRG